MVYTASIAETNGAQKDYRTLRYVFSRVPCERVCDCADRVLLLRELELLGRCDVATVNQCSCLYFDDLTGEIDPECPELERMQ